jgi:hypothetical protein
MGRNMVKKAAHAFCQQSLAIKREMGDRLDITFSLEVLAVHEDLAVKDPRASSTSISRVIRV